MRSLKLWHLISVISMHCTQPVLKSSQLVTEPSAGLEQEFFLTKQRMMLILLMCCKNGKRNIWFYGAEKKTEHNLKLVTTNFTGWKPDEIYADFVFTDDGKYLIKCKNNCVPEDCIYDPGNDRSIAYFRISDCEGCPYKEWCQPRFLKTRVRKEVSWKSVGRAKQLQ